MSARRIPPACKRKGCEAPRERWQLVCPECWASVPAPTRQRYAAARRLHLTRIAKTMGSDIVRLLGRKPAQAPDAAPPRANRRSPYAQIATLTGDRDALEAAE